VDKKYYKEALDVQSACNGMGVIRSLMEVVTQVEVDMKTEHKQSTYQTNPVLVMYADKLADLCDARVRPKLGDVEEVLCIAKIIGIVREHLIKEKECLGTDAFNKHPLIRYMAYVFHRDTGAWDSKLFESSYDECKKVSEEV